MVILSCLRGGQEILSCPKTELIIVLISIFLLTEIIFYIAIKLDCGSDKCDFWEIVGIKLGLLAISSTIITFVIILLKYIIWIIGIGLAVGIFCGLNYLLYKKVTEKKNEKK